MIDMQINDYIEALPTHRDENYLYTDARDAMEPVEDVVNASIDATGIGGSVVGKVLNVADCGAVESTIAQELVNLNTVVISDVLGIEFNEENPTPVEVMLSSEGGKSVLAQSRVDIVATENSKSQMIVRTNGLKSAANCVMSIDVKANATLDVVFADREERCASIRLDHSQCGRRSETQHLDNQYKPGICAKQRASQPQRRAFTCCAQRRI